MAYDIKKSNGNLAATVLDGSLNTTFDITLIGKNYAGYGIPQNSNFLHLLENFANDTFPSKATTGQLWYETSTKRLKVNTGTSDLKEWHVLGITESTETENKPTNLSTGNFWWDTTTNNLYCKTNTANLQFIGGSLTGIKTKIKSSVVKDNAVTPVDRDIIEVIVNDVTVYVMYEGTSAFTLNASTPITGFTSIKPGITSKDVNQSTFVTSTYKFWGTATNSDRLGGNLAETYISTSSPFFADIGLTIGNETAKKKLYIYNDTTGNAVTPTIENKLSEKIVFKTFKSNAIKTALEINGADILPGTPSTSNIGASGSVFNQIHATSFKGTADSADQLKVGTSYVSASDTPTSGTIVARTSATSKYLKVSSISGGNNTTFTVSNPHAADGTVTFTVKQKDGTILAGPFTASLTQGQSTVVLDSGLTTAGFETGGQITQTSSFLTGGQFGYLTMPAGSIVANYFVGTSTTANGDVAEKYLADDTYDEGTVLMIGGEQEVTAATYGKRALGAISINPAVIMNSELVNGTLVALKGRVPVKVIGSVKKGDHLVAADTGVAKVLENSLDSWLVFAVALEDNSNDTIKIVESVIL